MFTLHLMVPFSMSISIEKITEKIMEENYNKNDTVYILPS